MKPKLLIPVSILIHLSIGLLAALIIVWSQGGFGFGDISAFLFWTFPLAILIALSGVWGLRRMKRNSKFSQFFLLVAGTMAIVLLWTFAVYSIIGPWINAFSIPITFLWGAGGFIQYWFINNQIN